MVSGQAATRRSNREGMSEITGQAVLGTERYRPSRYPPDLVTCQIRCAGQDGPTGHSPMSRCSAPGSGRRWGLSVASGGRRPRCRSDARRFRSGFGRRGRDARTWLMLIRVVVADRVSRCGKRSTTTSRRGPSAARAAATARRNAPPARRAPAVDTRHRPDGVISEVVTSGVRSWRPPGTRPAPS